MTEHDDLEELLRSRWEASLSDVAPPVGLAASVRARARGRQRRHRLTAAAFGVSAAVSAVCLAAATFPGGSGHLAATGTAPPSSTGASAASAADPTASDSAPPGAIAGIVSDVANCLQDQGLTAIEVRPDRLAVEAPSAGQRQAAEATISACYTALLPDQGGSAATIAPGLPADQLAVYTIGLPCGTWVLTGFTHTLAPNLEIAERAFTAELATEVLNGRGDGAQVCAQLASGQ